MGGGHAVTVLVGGISAPCSSIGIGSVGLRSVGRSSAGRGSVGRGSVGRRSSRRGPVEMSSGKHAGF